MRAILRFIRHGRTARDPVPQVVIPEPMALRVGELLHDRKHAGRPRPPGRIVEEIDTGECCWCDIREADTDEAALVVVEELSGKRPVPTKIALEVFHRVDGVPRPALLPMHRGMIGVIEPEMGPRDSWGLDDDLDGRIPAQRPP